MRQTLIFTPSFFLKSTVRILIILIVFCLPIQAQNIQFTDANLKNALVNYLPNIDLNNDLEISIEEANLITELKLSNKNIASIEDLVAFEHLKKLIVDTNAIYEIPLDLLQKLSYLSIVKNQITQIQVVGSNTLDSLYIEHNLLTIPNFQNFTNLSELNISNNPITEVKVEGLSNLKSFTFSDTQLKTLNFTGLSNLTSYFGNITLDTLYAQSGFKQITVNDIWKVTVLNYDFSNNADFVSFNAKWNYYNAFSVNFENCTNLESIDVFDSKIEGLNVKNCRNIKSFVVNTARENFRFLKKAIDLSEVIKNPNLEKLICYYFLHDNLNDINNLTRLKDLQLLNPLPEGELILTNLDSLKIAHFTGFKKVKINQCKDLESISSYGHQESSFEAIDSLTISNCNNLRFVGTKVHNLKIQNCPKFKNFSSLSLKNIWFDSCNAFTTFPGGWWTPDFKETLKSLQVTNCKGIENLNISWPTSKINFINLEGSSNLKELHVAGHNLETVDLSTNTKLEKIFLQNNNLKSLDVSHLPNLNTLNIANNPNLQLLDLNFDHQLAKLYISGMNKGFFACVENPSDVNIDSVFVDADGIKRFYNCDTIVFKDKTLEQVLLNFNPPIDTNNDGVISMYEAKNFTSLVLSDLGISFTDGLEFFRNLDTLILNNNFVNTFNAINFSGLQYLDLSSNLLAQLILFRPNAEEAYSETLQILSTETLDSTYNSTLQTLLVNNNELKELDVTKVVNLNSLNAQNNPLVGICVNQNQLDNWVTIWDKDAEAIWSVNCDEVTSSNYIQQNFAPAYPNPAQQYIYINATATGIIDINGKLVQNISINTKFIPLQLSPGLYFIQYHNGKVEKLIIR